MKSPKGRSSSTSDRSSSAGTRVTCRRNGGRPQRPGWRLDPSSPHRLPIATGTDVRLIIVCNEGYSSSLATATLHELGL